MINSTLTIKEYYKLHGTVPEETLEKLVDMSEKYDKVLSAIDELDKICHECSTGYTTEDEMHEILYYIRNIIKTTRSKSVIDQLKFIEELVENKQEELYHQGEYCKDFFEQFIKRVNEEMEK